LNNQSTDAAGQKKTAGGPAVFQDSVAYFSAYARISLPPEALENQK
jgi:hypothetical protein